MLGGGRFQTQCRRVCHDWNSSSWCCNWIARCRSYLGRSSYKMPGEGPWGRFRLSLKSVRYETINDTYTYFFFLGGVTSMKRCHLPSFFLPKKRSPLQQWSGNGRGVFCGEKFPSGWGELAAKDAVESVQRNRSSTFQEFPSSGLFWWFFEGWMGEEMGPELVTSYVFFTSVTNLL